VSPIVVNLPTVTYFAEPSGGASGQASDIAIHAKEILRVRQLLTGIYQRHCAKDGEAEALGLERFGKIIRFQICWLNLMVLYSSLHAERALERDYFMTGSCFSSLWFNVPLICAE
jgi:ATP-dependent Clp protease protease subunit